MGLLVGPMRAICFIYPRGRPTFFCVDPVQYLLHIFLAQYFDAPPPSTKPCHQPMGVQCVCVCVCVCVCAMCAICDALSKPYTVFLTVFLTDSQQPGLKLCSWFDAGYKNMLFGRVMTTAAGSWRNQQDCTAKWGSGNDTHGAWTFWLATLEAVCVYRPGDRATCVSTCQLGDYLCSPPTQCRVLR